MRLLIHRQRLGQVPGEIRIEAAHHAHMIGKHLQRKDTKQGIGAWIRFGKGDQVVGVGAQVRVLLCDDDGPAAADSDLVNTADDQRHIFRSGDTEHGEVLAHGRDSRQRPLVSVATASFKLG